MSNRVPKVLVVDDEDELADFLAKSIAKANVLTKAVYSAIEAVELLKTESIDVVLTDMRMPQMDGIALIDWMRDHLDPCPAVFVLTGYADENLKALADLKPNGIFQKPSDVKAAVDAVTKAALKATSNEK